MSQALPRPNILTVDVEEWFHILEVEGGYSRDDWSSLESRVEANTETLLEIFAETRTTATFFVVGWVAWKHPKLVRRIADAGHEIGSHSFWHEVVPRHTRASFREDLGASKNLLEQLSGRPVLGFRAPGGSITTGTAWAFDAIAETGFRYDASVNPGHSSHGGFPTPHRGPHRIRCEAGEVLEIPWTTVGFGARRVPYAGGGYLRLFPYGLIRGCVAHDNRSGRPATVYVHPREIDPEQPRMALPWQRRFKYYVGLRSTAAKLRALLRDFEFASVERWLAANDAAAPDAVYDVRELASRSSDTGSAHAAPPPPPVGVA